MKVLENMCVPDEGSEYSWLCVWVEKSSSAGRQEERKSNVRVMSQPPFNHSITTKSRMQHKNQIRTVVLVERREAVELAQ